MSVEVEMKLTKDAAEKFREFQRMFTMDYAAQVAFQIARNYPNLTVKEVAHIVHQCVHETAAEGPSRRCAPHDNRDGDKSA